jgi:trehalose-6-phosphate synthase
VRLHAERVPLVQILALYRLADACVVSSLRDGLNLVAKEYVACRRDDDGCLVLSRHAGAAERMTEAVLVDPSDASAFADALGEAISGLRDGGTRDGGTRDGRRGAMRELRRRVFAENVYWWGAAIFARIAELLRPEGGAGQYRPRATKSRQ